MSVIARRGQATIAAALFRRFAHQVSKHIHNPAAFFPVIAFLLAVWPFAGLLQLDGRLPGGQHAFDLACYQVPVQRFAREEILACRVPLWLPYLGCGTPLHASQRTALAYPLLMPLVLAAGANAGIKLSLFLHLALCFSGQYLLARKLEVSSPAASFAALVGTWSAFLLDHLIVGHIPLVFGYALTPWFLLALVNLLGSPSARGSAALAAVTALFALVGHPQMLYYSLGVGAVWALAALATGRTGFWTRCGTSPSRWNWTAWEGHPPRLLLWLGVTAVAAILTAAIQWLPAAELARGGWGRGGRGGLEYAGLFSLDKGDPARLFVPFLRGDRLDGVPEFTREGFLHERGVYVGLLTVALAYWGLTRATAARWQHVAAWLVPVAFLIGLGNHTPLLAVAGKVVPGLLWFRCQGRLFGVMSILLALMAARGLDALMRCDAPAARRGRWSARLAACSLAALVADFTAAWFRQVGLHSYLAFASERLRDRFLELAAIGGATLAALWAVRRWGRWAPNELYAVVLALAALDLGVNSVGRFSLATVVPQQMPPRIAALDPPVRFARAASWPQVSRVSLQFSHVAPMALAARRSAVDTNEGGVLPAALDRLYSAIERDPETVLPLAGCGYVIGPSCSWLDVEGALPRVRFHGAAAAELCVTPVEQIDQPQLAALRQAIAESVRMVEDLPTRMTVEVTAKGDGMLVVADTYDRGWIATVDGRPVAVQAAHGVFRGVQLRGGRRRVEFVYAPRSICYGAAGSLCGVILIVVLVAISKSPRR